MGDDAIDRSQVWRTYDLLRADERVLWTDDYLAAFAQASGATLTTFDRKMPACYPSVEVELLPPEPGGKQIWVFLVELVREPAEGAPALDGAGEAASAWRYRPDRGAITVCDGQTAKAVAELAREYCTSE